MAKENKMQDDNDEVFTFGSKMGLPVYKVNSAYLIWAEEEDGLWVKYPELMARVQEEIRMRDGEGSHFYEDAL